HLRRGGTDGAPVPRRDRGPDALRSRSAPLRVRELLLLWYRRRLAAPADRPPGPAPRRAADGHLPGGRHRAVLRDGPGGERLRPRVRQRDVLAAPDLAGYRVPLLIAWDTGHEGPGDRP